MTRAPGLALGVALGVALAGCGDDGSVDSTAGTSSTTGATTDASESGGSEATTGGGPTSGMSDGTTSAGPTSDGSSSTTSAVGTTGGPECVDDVDCQGGACVDGACCSVDAVCGASCCSGSELCLFGQCVVPGEPCNSAADCDDGEYCEPALGEDEPPDPDPNPDENCTQELPPGGFCLELPKSCEDAPLDPNCVDACEYFPEIGPLNAAIKWQWGLYDAEEFPDASDVWATPTVARIYDANCDGVVDESDPPNIVVVSGDTNGTCCSCGNEPISTCRTGILRLIDGSNGKEIWSLEKAKDGAEGFAGMSVALGDIDKDGSMDIIAMTGDGYPVWISNTGEVVAIANTQVDGWDHGTFGWGGGLALGDMGGDGWPEIAYGRSVYTTAPGTLTHLWSGTGGTGGGMNAALSYMVDLSGDGLQELLAGNTAYRFDGTTLWQQNLTDGFTAVGDLDADGAPEIVFVHNGSVRVLEGADGSTELGPVSVPGVAGGGPPTIANFDGGDDIEIGIATGSYYIVYKPNYEMGTLDIVWSLPTKDTSSRITGSSVFDFEGDGRAEVIYSDECFLWVLDGVDGSLRFAAPNTTFTATEAIIVADVDGDGHAEIVRVSNSANWSCNQAPWTQPDPMTGRPGWTPPEMSSYYQGITAFGDSANSWVGTRSIWNQHAYFVSNICDPRDSACNPGAVYGEIPAQWNDNWDVPWLNNFRQNVQDGGLFDAPDPAVTLTVKCTEPLVALVTVRNLGLVGLPAGVTVALYRLDNGMEVELTTLTTSAALLPGQSEVLEYELAPGDGTVDDLYMARILIDPDNPTFHECKDDNNETPPVDVLCVG